MIKAAVMKAPNCPMEVVEFPTPKLEPGAVLLQTVFSEVCGTDCLLHRGKLAQVPYPIIPGHVSVGTIVEMNGPVADLDGEPSQEGPIEIAS